MGKQKFLVILFIIFVLYGLWPRDIHPKVYFINMFIHDQESYQQAQVLCGKYKKITDKNYCRAYITKNYGEKVSGTIQYRQDLP